MSLPLATFTVNDGASTPVAQTFTVQSRDGMVSQFRNMAAGLVRGMQVFTHEIRIAKTNAAANRVLISLATPVEGTVDGSLTVLRSSLFKVEANFAPDASEAERATAYGLFLNALAQADIQESVEKLQTLA
jgi:hypothetical protein